MENNREQFKYNIGDLIYAENLGIVLYVLKCRRSRIKSAPVTSTDPEKYQWTIEAEYLMHPNHGDAVWYPESHIEEMISEGWKHQCRRTY